MPQSIRDDRCSKCRARLIPVPLFGDGICKDCEPELFNDRKFMFKCLLNSQPMMGSNSDSTCAFMMRRFIEL